MVPVSVTDANGGPMTGLAASSFQLVEEGRQQPIESVGTAENVPLEIALLFDISATTSPMFKFQQETAAKFLLDVMKPTDRATIYTVGSQPLLIKDRATAADAVAAVKAIIPTKEFTAFFDSVSAAAAHLEKNAPDGTRRVMLVISDGEDTNSSRIAKALQAGYAKVGKKIDTIDSKELLDLTVKNRDAAALRERVLVSRSLQNADTVFYAINPAGSSYQLNKISLFGQENMQKFADETGGAAFLPKFLPIDTPQEMTNAGNTRRNTETLDRIFRQLANELRAQYLIQYYSDGDFPASRFVKVDVKVNQPGAVVRSRKGYYPK